MEALVMPSAWHGRRVLVTGHTGFKGAWLALWLHAMGAKVSGFALPAQGDALFRQAGLESRIDHVEGDLRDREGLGMALRTADPELVFHLAAQPLVRESYRTPVETWATNVQGTVHLLDACRDLPSLRAVLCVTSDKCYENNEWPWPYRENDAMGGHDPYSSSKGAAELAISAWRRSFFGRDSASGLQVLVASARAGNVIGGGDWAQDRLGPDILRALAAGRRPMIRNPAAIRPWQHVLDALHGYLILAERMLAGDAQVATGWNFGPAETDVRPVAWVADRLTERWGAPGWDTPIVAAGTTPHEAGVLKLDCARARSELGWHPRLDLAAALDFVVDWHRLVWGGGDACEIMLGQIESFCRHSGLPEGKIAPVPCAEVGHGTGSVPEGAHGGGEAIVEGYLS